MAVKFKIKYELRDLSIILDNKIEQYAKLFIIIHYYYPVDNTTAITSFKLLKIEHSLVLQCSTLVLQIPLKNFMIKILKTYLAKIEKYLNVDEEFIFIPKV